jgi:hypothetical protein
VVDLVADAGREKESATWVWVRHCAKRWECANVSGRAGMCHQAMLFPCL